MRSSFLRNIAILITVIFFSTFPVTSGQTDRKELIILHINDFHGNLLPIDDKNLAAPPQKVGGAAYMAPVIKSIQKDNPGKVLLLNAGDFAQGTMISNLFSGIPVVDFMNYLGFDAMALGNHEFDWSTGGLLKMMNKAKFPLLCSNVIDERTGNIPSYLKPYVIIKRNGLKIGIIGVISLKTPLMCNPKSIEHLKFIDPCECVKKYSSILNSKGINFICVLSHLGLESDKRLAMKVPSISCIIGGHSHTVIERTENVNNIPIVQAGCNGKYVGELKLTVDSKTGKILDYNSDHELIPIIDKNIKPDKTVEKMLQPYFAKIKPIMSEVVGEATEDMINKPPAGYAGTPIGGFITDAVRETYETDVAAYNTDGIRTPIYKGLIKKGDVFSALPFDNNIVTVDLTGKEIVDMMEIFISSPKYVQISGMDFTYYPNREKGKRLEDITIGGKPIDLKKKYKFATVDFLFFVSYVNGGEDVLGNSETGYVYRKLAREVIENYIRQKKSVSPPTDLRIKVVKDN